MRRGLVARVVTATGAGPRDQQIQRLRDATEAVRLATNQLSEPLIEHVRDRTGATREQAARYGVSHRIVRGADRRHQSYRRVESAGRTLRAALREVADALDDIHVPQQLTGRYRTEALEDEKARLGREARDAAALVDAVLWAEPQLRLIEDDLDDDLAQWINIADVSFEVAGAGMARAGASGSLGGSARGSLQGGTKVRSRPGRGCSPRELRGRGSGSIRGRGGGVALGSAAGAPVGGGNARRPVGPQQLGGADLGHAASRRRLRLPRWTGRARRGHPHGD